VIARVPAPHFRLLTQTVPKILQRNPLLTLRVSARTRLLAVLIILPMQ